ncbi:MAG: hypothetical protein JRJ12_14455, partial [Deltaproteobacteria bacterium]|nr:hypothetical protein [Deltaproteobacteria bacterium]
SSFVAGTRSLSRQHAPPTIIGYGQGYDARFGWRPRLAAPASLLGHVYLRGKMPLPQQIMDADILLWEQSRPWRHCGMSFVNRDASPRERKEAIHLQIILYSGYE